MTADKIALGRSLFFDKRLSADRTVSCATCHDPATAFTDGHSLPLGVSAKVGARNAPTILNAAFVDKLFWDGRASSLEDQVIQPMLNPFEMAMQNTQAVVDRIRAIPEYREKFRAVFNESDITFQIIAKAIATFERTQLSGNSPFDRFITGDDAAITETQKRGWELFKGRAGCIQCHSFNSGSPFFTDFQFHNTGVLNEGTAFQSFSQLAKEVLGNSISRDEESGRKGSVVASKSVASKTEMTALAHSERFSELGRYIVTKQAQDIGAFKTPTLRDIELTRPYMHNGSIKTLLDVVQFYNRGGNGNTNLDRRIQSLHLNDEEVNEIVEFMRSLTSDDVLRECQQSTPQTRSPEMQK